MGFIPKKKDDETKKYTPLTDPDFRNVALSPITIEERRKWEVMFTRFHRPHQVEVAEIIKNNPVIISDVDNYWSGLPLDGILYEMLTCDAGVLSWGWKGDGNTFLGLEAVKGGDSTGGYDTYIGYQAGYYSTTSTANVSVGAGSGQFLRTQYVIDPNVDYQFTQRREEPSLSYQFHLSKHGDYLLAKELRTAPIRLEFLKTTDGVNWSDWFSINTPGADASGMSCVEFLNKLYINWYDDDYRLRVWDGNTVTSVFDTVLQNNYLIGRMIVHGSYLWIITDMTPYHNDRRVIYWTADAITWNPITNYGGATYIDYNSAYPPRVGGDCMGSLLGNRWLEFNGSLYLFTSTYNLTNSSWSWQVWSTSTTVFTKIYDSSVLNDDYCLSSVVTDGTIIIVTGNTTASGGNYESACKVYRSTNLTTWDVVATLPTRGLCYESIKYGGIFYSMFVDQDSPYYCGIYYWDDANSVYIQCNSDITTEAHYISGNIIEYKGSFFVGKLREIYELTRTKTATITVTDKLASGNTIVGAAAGDMPITGNLNCLFGYNSNLSSAEIENSVAIGAYAQVSRDNTIVLGATGTTYQPDVAIGQTYALGRLHVHQYGEKEIATYGLYIDNIATNTAFDGINKYGAYITSTGAFTGSTGTACANYGLYVDAITGGDTNYGIYSEDNITTEDQFISSLADGGVKPIGVTSTVVCTNLNADLLDGSHSSAFAAVNHKLLSATHDDTTAATPVLGDTIYADANTKWVKLAGQTTTTKKYLSQTGTGAISAVPGWAEIAQADISGLKTTDGPSFGHLHLTITTGTAPFVIASTTVTSNLNADLLDDLHSSSFIPRHVEATATPGVNDDITNYLEGTIWIEQDANKAYILVDNTDGNAVWTEIGAGGGASAFLDLTDVDEADYMGHAAEFVVVNGTADGLVFSASSVAGHAMLSASHTDSTAAAVVRGDIIIGSVAAPNTKWTRLAVGAAGTYLAGSATEPSWATLNQAAVAGLTTADGPSLDHLHLTIAAGTAPLVVASDTEVANLNAHLLQGYHANAFLLTATTGATITVSDSAASGGTNGDIWLEY
jgi:hypothetical protein